MARHPETEVIHAGEGAREGVTPLGTPIYQTSTFVFANAAELEAYQQGKNDKYIYSRYANPTVQAAETKLAALEGAEAALLTSSGMAATSTALFGLLSAGDELVCCSAIYGGTLNLAASILARFGVSVRFVTPEALQSGAAVFSATTRVVWFESPINPTLRCVDIAAVAARCRQAGVLSIIDSTFASPVNQQPLTMGVDLVMHSATKYLNGHSDITAGGLCGSRAILARLDLARKSFGGVIEPVAAQMLSRGMKTLAVRVERQNANAMAVATHLERHPGVSRVFYPGLASHPDHALAQRQMRGFGGMVTIDVKGGYAAACRAYDRFTLIQRAASLGGVESLCSLPVLTSQHGHTDEQLQAAGVTRGMMRLSIGLEHVSDVIADLDQALS